MRVLVVDDEPQILRALGINLRARKYEVHTAANGTDALAVAASAPPDLVVLDLGLPDMDGVDVIHGLANVVPVRTRTPAAKRLSSKYSSSSMRSGRSSARHRSAQ